MDESLGYFHLSLRDWITTLAVNKQVLANDKVTTIGPRRFSHRALAGRWTRDSSFHRPCRGKIMGVSRSGGSRHRLISPTPSGPLPFLKAN